MTYFMYVFVIYMFGTLRKVSYPHLIHVISLL